MTGRVVRLSLELPAGTVMAVGLSAALSDLVIEHDGVIRKEHPHPMRTGDVVGTWAVLDDPSTPPAPGH